MSLNIDVMLRHGFSLLELLVSLSLVGILSSFAVTHFPAWIHARQADSTLNQLRTGINIARHTAITKNLDVILCPQLDEVCGPRNSWHRGTLIFEDHDANRRWSEGDVVVAHLPRITTGRVVWRAFRNRSYLRFTGRGLTDWQNGHLQYCPNDGNLKHARQVVLNYAGRTYSSRDADGDGVHEDASGDALTCS